MSRPEPRSVAERLSSPANRNIAWESAEIYEWQVDEDLLMRGYTSTGSPEQRRIQNDVATIAADGAELLAETVAGMFTANRASAQQQGKTMGPIAAARQEPEQERAAIIAENALLAEYLSWKKSHPSQDVQDFLKARTRR